MLVFPLPYPWGLTQCLVIVEANNMSKLKNRWILSFFPLLYGEDINTIANRKIL